jgi:uncharacterized membrane protein
VKVLPDRLSLRKEGPAFALNSFVATREEAVETTQIREREGRTGIRRQPYWVSDHINVSDGERMLSGIGGGILTLYGLKRMDWSGVALALVGGGLLYRALTGHSPLYHALGITTVTSTQGRQLVEVVKTVTINRAPEEIYRFWRNLENLPCFMTHLKTVEVLDDARSRWTADSPAGGSVTWEARIVNEKENELIAWQSLEGADVRHWGIVRFRPAPGGRGTEVKVELEYEPIGGTLGTAVAKLFGEEPAQQVEEDLRRFKQMMEAWEVPTTKGQPRGRG